MMRNLMGINIVGPEACYNDTETVYSCKSYLGCASDYRYWEQEYDVVDGSACGPGQWSSRGCCPF